MTKGMQVITMYLPEDFEEDFESFKRNIVIDKRIEKYRKTKKEQYVSNAVRVLIKWYNNARKKFYLESANKREGIENKDAN